MRPGQMTAASSLCRQSCRSWLPAGRHWSRLDSLPMQLISSSRIGPLPDPKNADFNPNDKPVGKIKTLNCQFILVVIIVCTIQQLQSFSLCVCLSVPPLTVTLAESELTTHYLRVQIVPAIVTHCAPPPIQANLNSALRLRVTPNQPQSTNGTRSILNHCHL